MFGILQELRSKVDSLSGVPIIKSPSAAAAPGPTKDNKIKDHLKMEQQPTFGHEEKKAP